MRISKMILMASVVFTLASCGGDAELPEEFVEPVMATVSVDTETSTLAWKGMKNESYFHTGTVSFSEGSAEFIDGHLTSGTFTVDMKSMAVTDELPEEKKMKLIGHLGTEEFFNVAKNQTVSISCGAVADNKLPITISMSGIEITEEVPVTVSYEEGVGSIVGDFDVDFSGLKAVGFEPAEGEEEHVQPVINFKLDLKLK